MTTAKVIDLPATNGIQLPRTDLIVERVKITPKIAAEWLKVNKSNRPVTASNVQRLSEQMRNGLWRLNGETIKISEDESVLDGQHRLLACIDSGTAFESIVIYGIEPEAFVTIDTGRSRSGADVIGLHFPEASREKSRVVATAAQYLFRIRSGWTSNLAKIGLSNPGVLDYVLDNPSLWAYASTLLAYPKAERLLAPTGGTALYYLFHESNPGASNEFMRRLYTGENLDATMVEMHLRALLIKDKGATVRMHSTEKLKAVIVAWNKKQAGRRVKFLPKASRHDPFPEIK